MIQKKERPRTLVGRTYRIPSGHGTLYVTVSWDEKGEMFEVFGNLGKAGFCQRAEMEEVARLCSLALRVGVLVEELIDQLRGIQCSDPIWHEGKRVTSVGDVLARVLEWARVDGSPSGPEGGEGELENGKEPAPLDGDDSGGDSQQVEPALEQQVEREPEAVAVR